MNNDSENLNVINSQLEERRCWNGTHFLLPTFFASRDGNRRWTNFGWKKVWLESHLLPLSLSLYSSSIPSVLPTLLTSFSFQTLPFSSFQNSFLPFFTFFHTHPTLLSFILFLLILPHNPPVSLYFPFRWYITQTHSLSHTVILVLHISNSIRR